MKILIILLLFILGALGLSFSAVVKDEGLQNFLVIIGGMLLFIAGLLVGKVT